MAEQLDSAPDETAVVERDEGAVTPAEADAPAEPPVAEHDSDLVPFGDVPLELGVQLDRREITVREALSLDEDSVVRLHRSTGENVDLLLNGVLAGGGEIVVIDDMVGLRITDIYSDGSRTGDSWRRRRP